MKVLRLKLNGHLAFVLKQLQHQRLRDKCGWQGDDEWIFFPMVGPEHQYLRACKIMVQACFSDCEGLVCPRV